MATLPEEFWLDPTEPPKVEGPPPTEPSAGIPEHFSLGIRQVITSGVPCTSTMTAGTPREARNTMMTADEMYVRCANGHPPLMFSIKCRPDQCYGECPVCGWKEKR